MSKLGTAGSVKFWMMARLVVYGEPGGRSSSVSLFGGGGDTVGACAGPLTGSAGGGAAFGEAGLGRASGAGATGTFASSILVAIEVPLDACTRLTSTAVAVGCSSSSLLS